MIKSILEAYWEAGGVSSPPTWLEDTAIVDMDTIY